jgi:glycosyltransferase involved in cell wall biosynthesis
VQQLFERYCRVVVGNGIARYRPLPYGFGTFDDGTPIPASARARYRTSAALREKAGPRPFASTLLAQGDDGDAYGPVATERLRRTYMYFLARQPDPSALQSLRPRCATLAGWLRVAAGVGSSPEARAKPGWQARLLFWPLLQLPLGAAPASVLAAAPPPDLPRATKRAAPPSAAPADATPGINLAGYIAAELGVGEGARALARACVAAGVRYGVTDLGYQTPNLQRDKSALAHATPGTYPIDLMYVNADQTARTAAYLDEQGVRGRYRIGFWHWEQPQLPPAHLPAFAHVDEIWTPSRFVRDAVAAVSPVPVYLVPHAIEIAPTPGAGRAAFGLPENRLLVLMMYDFHSYQYRKNPQAAIAAFRQAAQGRADCALVVKTINGDAHPEAYAQLRAHLADLPDVTFIDGYLTRQETWDLQAGCDILLSLHRAEGFGLAPAEMMYLGKPVVATGWSANMDFMNHDNSMPVAYTLQPLREDLGAYPAGPLWAEADTAHAAQCLTRLFDDALLRTRLGARAAQDIRAQLSPAAVGALVRERLRALAYWHPGLRG